MNLIECVVTKVLGHPYENYGRWWVKVEYNSYDTISETIVMCGSKEQALNIKEGYTFLS